MMRVVELPMIIQTIVATHVCIAGVYYCQRCDRLYVPFLVAEADPDGRDCHDDSIPFYVMHTPQFGCWFCHAAICGGWLAAMMAVIFPGPGQEAPTHEADL